MKALFSISWLVAAGLWSAIVRTNAQVNVTQYHNHSSRDGLYIDSAFTPSAAANLARDLNFDGTIVGGVYTQPLYIEGPGGRATIIAVTESNNVYALDAVNGPSFGSEMWASGTGKRYQLHLGWFPGDHRHACCRSRFTGALFERNGHARWRRDHQTLHYFS